MKVTPLKITDVLIFEPTIFDDKRGLFFESFNQEIFQSYQSRQVTFVQDNQSRSVHGVLRGLHYQLPKPQGKLLRVLAGEIFDVAVDIRSQSSTFGECVSQVITAENKKQIWIPEGFAHGFYVLSEWADVLYKTTDYYSPTDENGIVWNDPKLGIDWPLGKQPILSKKDSDLPNLDTAMHFDGS